MNSSISKFKDWDLHLEEALQDILEVEILDELIEMLLQEVSNAVVSVDKE